MGSHEGPSVDHGPQGLRGPQGRQGDQGRPGNRGERGDSGMSPPVRRALAALFMLSIALGGLGLFWTAWEVRAIQSAQQQQTRAVEQKLCATFGKLAALRPPAGNPAKNPSRAFDDNLHATLDELGTDLGCR